MLSLKLACFSHRVGSTLHLSCAQESEGMRQSELSVPRHSPGTTWCRNSISLTEQEACFPVLSLMHWVTFNGLLLLTWPQSLAYRMKGLEQIGGLFVCLFVCLCLIEI